MQNLPTTLPDLCFFPVDGLLIHERHDNQRTRPLIRRIRQSGLWRNPPVVSPLDDSGERGIVLDGANRITALQQMGYPHALVQLIRPDDPGLKLQTWNHVIWEYHAARFLNAVRRIPGVQLHRIDPKQVEPGLESECGLALVISRSGRAYSVCTEDLRLDHRVETLNAVVDSYKDAARLDRTGLRDVDMLQRIYPALCGVVIFPKFDIHDLLRLAERGYLLPPGVTRFTISPRALHLNYPLDELAAPDPLEAKNARLHTWIQERIASKGVRYYAEPTYLFDE